MGGPTGWGPMTGESIPLNRRAAMIRDVWGAAVARALRHGCEHFVVAGDLFDTANPSPRVLTAMARALDAAGELHFHLLVGNHDQRSDARGDNALAVLASIPNVTVYERPTFTHLGDEPFLFVPFYKPTLEDRGDALDAQVELAFKGSGVPATLVTHFGVEDASTPPYLRGAHDAVHVDDVMAVMMRRGFPLCVTGNWHTPNSWAHRAGAPMVEQCGALVPTGFDNPGPDYGHVVIAAYRGDGLPAVSRVKVGGPRFYTVQVREGDERENWRPLVERTFQTMKGRSEAYIQFRSPPAMVVGVTDSVARVVDEALGRYLVAWEVVPDSATTHEAQAAARAAVATVSGDVDAMLAAHVEAKGSTFPRIVRPTRVLSLAREYLGKASA